MESMGGGGGGGPLFLDGEWESLCKLFTTEQDQDLSFDHYLGHNSNPLIKDCQMLDPINSFFNQESVPTPNSAQFSQTCSSDLSYDSSNGLNSMMQPNYNDDQISSFDYVWEEGLAMGHLGFPALIEGTVGGPVDGVVEDHQPLSTKRKSISKCGSDDQLGSTVDEAPVPKKRARVSKNAGKRKKRVEAVEEETKKSDGDISDIESNDSEEVTNNDSKVILNLNGKKRASRGAATDPQSLYARRRRERINERLRILQTLVPNGTKVDISTMLEEAVNYVKFMQLQIKLLSSDETWMYAPLAYNGFDMGFYKRFSAYC